MSATRAKTAERFPSGIAAPKASDPSAAPPPPNAADRRAVKALVRGVAAEFQLGRPPALPEEIDNWLRNSPQLLWPLLDAAVAACNARKRGEHEVDACHWLLDNQLTFIRYRLEAGYDWARAMLEDFQERLVALGQGSDLPPDDWFQLVNLLQTAKVPVSPGMADALALAMASGDASATDEAGPETTPAELARQMGALLDQLARVSGSPFAVIEALSQAGAMIPAEIRVFLVHEMGLSPHAMIRETVPLLLLDHEKAVRQAAAAILSQVAGPEAVSPVMLRRVLLLRNWVPAAEREAIDQLVRKLRLKGVECAQWVAAPALTYETSMIDGSGAQSALLTTPKGRTGLFAGLLLKHSFGVRDAWCDPAMPRRDINAALSGVRAQTLLLKTGRGHLDAVVQHHIARGLAEGHLPPADVVGIAEAIGAADWKERGLDVAAEIAGRFAALAETARSEAAIAASLARSGAFVTHDETAASWFEDGPAVRALAGRGKKGVQRLLEEILPARRETWAEKLLLTILWLEAGADAARGALARDLTVLAHELVLGRRALAALPAMVEIAKRSLYVAGVERW